MNKQERLKLFALEYIANNFNATKAYMAVYPEAAATTAHKNAYLLVKDPIVQEAKAEYLEARMGAADVEAERVLRELEEMAYAAKGDEIYNSSVKLKALELIQKQRALQTQKIESKVEQVMFVEDLDG